MASRGPTAEAQLRAFFAKYAPDAAAAGRKVRARLRELVPGATELVYDNYNGLVIGFGPSERASDAVLSMIVLPDHVSVCFLQDGPDLPDPTRILRGSGTVVRHVRLATPDELEQPAILELIRTALKRADVPINPKGRRKLVIRSVSKKQRPRRLQEGRASARPKTGPARAGP